MENKEMKALRYASKMTLKQFEIIDKSHYKEYRYTIVSYIYKNIIHIMISKDNITLLPRYRGNASTYLSIHVFFGGTP